MARTLLALCSALALASPAPAQDFVASFANVHDRVWAGPALWTNPMEDWRVHDDRLETISAGPNRNVHALTRQLGKKPGTLTMSVRLGRLDQGDAKGSAGFRVGVQDEIDDYRARLLYGAGLNVGVSTAGDLFIGPTRKPNAVPPESFNKGIELRLRAEPGPKQYALTLSAHDPAGDKQLGSVTAQVPAGQLYGNLALVSNHFGTPKKGKKAPDAPGARFWFDGWKIAGSKVEVNDDHAFGPILWSMYTLSRGVLKMTAQMPPVGPDEAQTVRLQIKDNGDWKTVGEAKIAPLSYTAAFRVPKWNDKQDVPYRLVYAVKTKDGKRHDATYAGTVRKDPVDKDTLVVGALSCMADYGFPFPDLVRNLTKQDPDLLFFAGDQIYEGSGGFPLIRTPVDRACLNYLRKWYVWGWTFRDLLRDRPSVSLPDDHDVYQGNIWGNGGNPVSLADHAKGGYVQHRDFVNCVHRTQTSHLPDPFDPTPIKQGITVYYGDLIYGRVGFAIVADRMFKNGPEGNVPAWPGRPDHVRSPKVDVTKLDRPGLVLLGDRQEKYLRHWATDWKGVDMKCLLSQTIFCNLANYHGPQREFLVADLDSGGWPQSGRNRAYDLCRRAFALHLAGDQHLASLVHHGLDAQADANYSFCVPSLANVYPRAWMPDKEGLPVVNRPAPGLPNTGDYQDGLKNRVRVYAVGNPEEKYRPGRYASLQDKGCGHGIVRFNKKDRTIALECWRLFSNPADPRDQFPGWPKTIQMTDNYGRKPAAYLPTLEVKGLADPVVQVIDEAKDEVVYTLRIKGDRFRPMVFAPGRYTVVVGEPGTERLRTLRGVEPAADAVLRVTFE